MKHPNRSAAAILLSCLAVGTAACSSNGDGKGPASSTPSTPAASSPVPSPSDTRSETQKLWDETMAQNEKNQEAMHRQAAAAASNDPNSTETAELPDMVGMPLDDADDIADGAGFMWVIDEDATGQGRAQVQIGSDWRVCSQDPAPGTERVEVLVTLSVVKQEETCP